MGSERRLNDRCRRIGIILVVSIHVGTLFG